MGALLGDFVRGTPESLVERLPKDLIEGIMLHRAIDRFTDHHEIFLEKKKLLSPERTRFAGMIIDVFFDHFLTKYWDDFGTGDLKEFIDGLYQLLMDRSEWLTDELREIVPRMKDENWLLAYGSLDSLALTFRRISRRRDFLTPLIGAEKDLEAHYGEFEAAFLKFYPELLEFANDYRFPEQ